MTTDQLKYIVPSIKPDNLNLYVPLLNQYMDAYQINSKARIAPFIANVAHESGGFNYTKEIASGAAYEGRTDLGNTQPGDGVKYKGRGLIQISGRGMYATCGHELGQDFINHPEILEQPQWATESACWFWTDIKSLNVIADKPDNWTRLSKNGNTYTKFQWIVRLINGGLNGLLEREQFLQRANDVL